MKDTMEVQKVEMKDARTPEKTTEKTNAPKTGDSTNIWLPILLLVISTGGMAGLYISRKRKSK